MEKEKSMPSCADCGVLHCFANEGTGKQHDFCLSGRISEAELKEVMECYDEADNRSLMLAAAEVEYEGYRKWTRVQEIMEFARKLGAEKIGIATCIGLIREARTFAKILRSNGFKVFGVGCKIGEIEKTAAGIPSQCSEVGINMCNPILQAKLLNREGTELNVVVGLCVGHDSLFYKYAEAPVTTLITKDRVLGHNPAAALYTADTYYSKLAGSSAVEAGK